MNLAEPVTTRISAHRSATGIFARTKALMTAGVALAAGFLSGEAAAADYLRYLPSNSGNAYRINAGTGAVIDSLVLTGVPLGTNPGMTYRPALGGGILYYMAGSTANLYALNPDTMAVYENRILTGIPISTAGASLAYFKEGLYYLPAASSLIFYLAQTGSGGNWAIQSSSQLVGVPISQSGKAAIAYDPASNTLFYSSPASAQIFRLSPGSPNAIVLGSFLIQGIPINTSTGPGLAFANGKLLYWPAGTASPGSGGLYYELDPITGAVLRTVTPSVIVSGASPGLAYVDRPTVDVIVSDGVVSEPLSPAFSDGSFTVRRNGNTTLELHTRIRFSGSAASEPGVPSPADQTIEFRPGEKEKTVYFSIADDNLLEGTESLRLDVVADASYVLGAASSATISIPDNDTKLVTIVANDASATEGADGGSFRVSVTPVQGANLVVPLKAPTGTAISGTDYSPLPASVTIPAGQPSVDVPLNPITDGSIESPETVILGIATNSNYTIGNPGSATVTITEKTTVSITTVDDSATEGDNNAKFRISREVSNGVPLVVKLAVPTGTATSGSDYQVLPTSVTLGASALSVDVTLTQINDTVAELPETVILAVANDAAYFIGSRSAAMATIYDNEKPLVSIVATDATGKEASNNHGSLTLNRLGKRSSISVAITRSGTATFNDDYHGVAASIAIPEGVSSVVVPITVVDDAAVEGDETVICTLATGSSYTVGSASSATVTIQDTSSPLPASWLSSDIGPVPLAGSGAYAPLTQTFTVRGCYESPESSVIDGFHFVHRTLTGDGQIIARMSWQRNTNNGANAGLMLRETLAPDARMAFMALTPANGANFIYRNSPGTAAGSSSKSGHAAPKWLKLVRAGSVFTGSVSTDGIIWTVIGSRTITMATTLSVGMVVSSRDVSRLGVASFEQVSVATSPLAAAIKVNFQPATAPTVAGYLVDSGLAFGDRTGGQSYGWNLPTLETRDRNLNADQLRDTLNHMQATSNPTATWEIALPDGRYQVLVVAGDASAFDSVYRMNVEGVAVVNGTPTSANRWVSGTVTVDVKDGRLTLSSAAGAVNNKVCYLEIIQVPISNG